MLGLHDGDVPYTDKAQEHLDRCLGCVACATACPSGVDYGRLLEDARDRLSRERVDDVPGRPPLTRLQRRVFFDLLARPERLRLGLTAARLMDKVGLRRLVQRLGGTKLLGPTLARMDALLPPDPKAKLWTRGLPAHSRAGGMDMVVSYLDPSRDGGDEVKSVVGFFEGCVAKVMAGEVHRKAAELICAAGVDVISPPGQVCCGAIHQHGGEPDLARDLARRNLDTFLPENGPDLSAIVTCTAGDGAMLRGYAHLFEDDPEHADRARQFTDRVRDVTELLLDIGVGKEALPYRNDVPLTAAYHDACHLAHAQRVTSPPRELLAGVPGLNLVPLPESDVCCGAAGTYNLTQPDMARRLADRKLDRFLDTQADVLLSGNVGCTMHLRARAAERGLNVTILHPVDVVHAAVFGGSVDV
jgi:glycolate oxidase iron-sulfur subunit